MRLSVLTFIPGDPGYPDDPLSPSGPCQITTMTSEKKVAIVETDEIEYAELKQVMRWSHPSLLKYLS